MDINLDKILDISNEIEFNETCLRIFNFQYSGVEIYKKYIDLLKINPKKINHYSEIPFLPIQFFKNYSVIQKGFKPKLHFKSSGTTSNDRSNHLIANELIYQKNSLKMFESFFGNIKDYIFLGLLPSYIENGESSLVYMVDYFMKISNKPENGFYLYDFKSLNKKIINIEKQQKKAILFGVSYALYDFSNEFPMKLKNVKIIETGGMKGRKKEITKDELFITLKQNFQTSEIYSEYGMTELLSQSYARENKIYKSPPWKKILLRELDNPLEILKTSKNGAINIIDLANIYSCSFIETQDLGKIIDNQGFKILGRMEQSDLRGCNLLYN